MTEFIAEESSFEMIPEGEIVAAKVVSIEPKVMDFGPRLNWAFEVTESPWEGTKILGSSSQKFTIDPPSKFYEWAVQLLGRTFDVGDGIDTDDLIGLPCRIEIEYKPDAEDPERKWMRPATVIAPRGGTKTAEDVFG
jgi:hypothetical protein